MLLQWAYDAADIDFPGLQVNVAKNYKKRLGMLMPPAPGMDLLITNQQ